MTQKLTPLSLCPLEVLACGLSFFSSVLLLPSLSIAQIVPDGTTNTSIEENAGVITIRDGEQRGDALFHSFSQFDIEAGQQAAFEPANGISDIFTRVTGDTESSIGGELGVAGDANLYLINANGITFGPGSNLNIGGSFTATTASTVVFQNGSEFSTSDSQVPSVSFTLVSPITLEFREQASSPITVEAGQMLGSVSIGATLTVPQERSISLVGGDIFIGTGSTISAPGGININSYNSGSSIRILSNENGSLVTESNSTDFRDITITGPAVQINAFLPNPSRVPGNITFEGRNIRISQSFIVTLQGGEGVTSGDINLIASDSIDITQSNIDTGAFTNGNSGDIQFRAKNINILGPSTSIVTSAFGDGESGSVSLVAEETINISDPVITDRDAETPPQTSISVSFSVNNATSSAGFITFRAKNAFIDNAGILATTNGTPGEIIFDIENNLTLSNRSLISAETDDEVAGFQTGGNIELDVGNRIELNNSNITSAANGEAEGGAINIQASDLFALDNSGISAIAADNPGGNIVIDVDNLVARDNSDIVAFALNSSGGNITINAEGIFGAEVRDPTTPETSDINASSALGPQFDGVVEINTPDLDPSDNLEELPEEVIDPRSLVSANPCPEGFESEFVIEGSGGLPTSPGNTIPSGGLVPANLAEPVETSDSELESSLPSSQDENGPIALASEVTPAWGWVWNDEGEVLLTAHNPSALGSQRVPAHGSSTSTCSAR